jgi:hypothetical protein
LNASRIEYRSFSNERGHGFDSRVGPVMSFLHKQRVGVDIQEYKSGVSDNWCHAC